MRIPFVSCDPVPLTGRRRIALMIFFCMLLMGKTGAMASDTEWIFRPQTAVHGRFHDALLWSVKIEPHLTDRGKKAGETALETGLQWRILPWLRVSPFVKYRVDGDKDDERELRPGMIFSVVQQTRRFRADFRSKAEFRFREDNDDYWRLRPRIQLFWTGSDRWEPYVYEELFWGVREGGALEDNRIAAGLQTTLTPDSELEIEFRVNHENEERGWELDNFSVLATWIFRLDYWQSGY